MWAAATISTRWSSRAGSTGCSPTATRTEDAIWRFSRQRRSRCGPARTRPQRREFEALVREAAGQGRDLCADARDDRRAGARQGSAQRSRSPPKSAISSRPPRRGCRESSAFILHVGSTAILRADGKIANRAFLFAPDGALIAGYDKIHMFDVDLDNGESWRESAAYEPGTEAVVADMPIGQARLRHLLRRALPAALPRRGAGRRRGADRAGRLHPPDRAGALARPASAPARSRTAPW